MKQITTIYDGLRWVDPTATRDEAVAAILPPGEVLAESEFPCRITTERRRVVDRATGRRVTRDWRVGHFLLWRDGEGAPDMGWEETRAIFVAARASGVDGIVVYGCRALIASASIEFCQFGVRDLAEIPA